MPYRALVVKVMVVSPKHCDRQRTLIRALIHEQNVMHSQHRNLVLLPVGWDTHSAPLMGERAQEIINRQVLADCDLLVSTFWTRLGTPTGDSPSGSVEEIRRVS
jgi:hypothetical protein